MSSDRTMSAADPDTDDLADRLDEWADLLRSDGIVNKPTEDQWCDDLCAAAAELRRLRHELDQRTDKDAPGSATPGEQGAGVARTPAPHTDDLPDRLDEIAVDGGNPFDLRLNMTYAERENLRAAAAELRRLRHTVATLTDAIGDEPHRRFGGGPGRGGAMTAPADTPEQVLIDMRGGSWLRAQDIIAALDAAGYDIVARRPVTCPTCGWRGQPLDRLAPGLAVECPDPWHREGR